MSFIARHVSNPDERIIYITRLHWIYFLKGMAWFAVFFLFGRITDWGLHRFFPRGGLRDFYIGEFSVGPPHDWVQMTAIIFGAMILLIHILNMLSTEIALTNRRIVYKKGWIMVEVDEIDLVEIRAEKINHGLLGRFLRYGSLHLDSRFVGDTYLPIIPNPYKFLQRMHKARAQHSETDRI